MLQRFDPAELNSVAVDTHKLQGFPGEARVHTPDAQIRDGPTGEVEPVVAGGSLAERR